jgi:hypothetical protein
VRNAVAMVARFVPDSLLDKLAQEVTAVVPRLS